MSIERSPFEGTFDEVNGKCALARVVSVDALARNCRVKTIGMAGKHGHGHGSTDDHDISDVQWLSTAGSDQGAEDCSIPVIGQVGVLIYINSEAYLIGFFRPLPLSPEDVPPNSPTPNPLSQLITQGDRLLSTIGGNSIILRSGGSIEVVSNALCRTYWLPGNNLLSSVCYSYELYTNGGFLTWEQDPQTSNTTLTYQIQDNLEPDNIIIAQYGSTDNGNIIDVAMGPADDNLNIPEPVFHIGMTPAGLIDIEVGNSQQFSMTVDPKTGDVSITTQGNITQTIQGNAVQTISGDLTQTVDGDVNITATGEANVQASVINLNGEEGMVLTTLTDPVVDLITLVPTIGVPNVLAGGS